MADILHVKNASTRFQILVEIASKGPAIEQKAIAANLGITPQAISEYLKYLIADGLVIPEGRSRYRVSSTGVNWMLKELRELNDYVSLAEKAVTDITVNAALADGPIGKGQEVGLSMHDGILIASPEKGSASWGVAADSADKGEDVGVTSVQGLIPLKQGTVFVAAVPGINEGGSRRADIQKLAVLVRGQRYLGAIGIEAFAALTKAGAIPRYFYAVPEITIEAVRYGLEIVVVIVSEELPGFIKRMNEAGIEPHFIELRPR